MPRGDFKAMLGMNDRGAADALGVLVKRSLLKSDWPQDKGRVGLRSTRCASCCRSCGPRRRLIRLIF